jgi:hypothetical protein
MGAGRPEDCGRSGLGGGSSARGHTGSAQCPHGGRSVHCRGSVKQTAGGPSTRLPGVRQPDCRGSVNQTAGGPPASSSPASSCVSNNWIYRGVFGLAGGFGAPGCTKVSLKPKYSRTLTPRSARAPRHAQRPAPSGNDTSQDRHDRHPARALPDGARRQASGTACGQPRRSQLNHRFDPEPPAGGDVTTLGMQHGNAPDPPRSLDPPQGQPPRDHSGTGSPSCLSRLAPGPFTREDWGL